MVDKNLKVPVVLKSTTVMRVLLNWWYENIYSACILLRQDTTTCEEDNSTMVTDRNYFTC